MIDHFRGRRAGPAATRSVTRAGVALARLLARHPPRAVSRSTGENLFRDSKLGAPPR